MWIPALLLFLASLLPAAPWQGAATLDAVLEKAVTDGTIPGGVLLVGQGDRILYHHAYGFQSLVPKKVLARVDTIYDCASLTKVVATAPSVMMLVEQGKVRLDDRVTVYLPKFRKGDSPITVRHLLTHYSGLRPDLDLEPVWSGYETGIEKAYQEVPIAEPGERFIYSDINYILLAEIVRQVTGQRIDAFARQNLFEPLGMTDAQFDPPAALRDRIAPTEKMPDGTVLHGVVHDPTTRYMGGVAGHAGLFATAADLSRYVRMILAGGVLDGKRTLSPLGLAAMTRPQSPEGKPERGLGWDINSPYASPRGDLFPVGSFGHTGFTGTSIWVDPGTKAYVILMTNRVHPVAGRGSVVSLRSRVASAIAAALAPPQAQGGSQVETAKPSERVLTGLDVLVAEGFSRLAGKKVGLITNHTGVDRLGRTNVELFLRAPNVRLAAIFAPEHGFAGKLDQERVADTSVEGVQVHSLYQGDRRRPTPEMMAGLDALVFDIQDMGVRFYTYATTLAYCLEEAAKVGLPVYVLDRPNPLTGVRVGGPVLRSELASFIGYLPGMPVQHGLTIGELALLFNQEKSLGADVRVVEMEGWRREMWFDETGLPWVNPSPNIRSLTQAILYPGVALLEGLKNYSVGRGTDAPFQFVGADWMKASEMATALAAEPGIRPYVVTRTPTESHFAGRTIPGLWLEPSDRESFDSLRFGLELATTLARLQPDKVDWDQTARLVGERQTLQEWRNGHSSQQIWARWKAEGEPFDRRRMTVLLY
ncbi:MAG: DUF1343 domain-containing protein [Acidobacteria bacterium]|nr:DUF1343 domain-containing protein [Acidobacteriota bacterium]